MILQEGRRESAIIAESAPETLDRDVVFVTVVVVVTVPRVVRYDVVLHIGPGTKPLAANIASERPQVEMNAFVDRQLVATRKRLGTDATAC